MTPNNLDFAGSQFFPTTTTSSDSDRDLSLKFLEALRK